MTKPNLSLVRPLAPSPIEAARAKQAEAEATADAAVSQLFAALQSAVDASEGVQGIAAIAPGIREEVRTLGPQIAAAIKRMQALRGRHPSIPAHP